MSQELTFQTRQLQCYQPLTFNEGMGESDFGPDLTISSSMASIDSYPPFAYLSAWDLSLPSPSPPPPMVLTRQCKKPRMSAAATNTRQLIGEGDGGEHYLLDRTRKLQFRNHIWSIKEKLVALELPNESVVDVDVMDQEGSRGSDGMRLVQLLLSCAEAVACRDRVQASALLTELKASPLELGTSFQRVASCFVQGLSDRLELVQPLGAVGIITGPATASPAASYQKEAGLALAYELCPYMRFGHFVANAAILEAFEGESLLHVVDLGMTMGLPGGHQWQDLIGSLAARPGGPPRRLRITGVGLGAARLQAIGEELDSLAVSVGMRLEFFGIESSLESLRSGDFAVEEGEALAVSSVLELHCVVKESRGALNSVLQMIRELSPRVLAVVEQDSSHNGPFFLGRFMEALHYYSAIFDSLEAALPRYDTRRAKVEQFFLAEEIKNIVSCEGPARVERHERVDQWRRRMSRAGFQPQPVKMAAQARGWLAETKAGEGYTVAEEKGCLVLGWKSKPIIAASCWKC